MHWAVLLVFAFPAEIFRSSDSSSTEKRLEINGYLKTLESFSYQKSIKNSISGHLLHNRINLRWRCSERFRLTLAFRNRLFHGEETKLDPGFSGRLRNHNESLALEKFWIKESSLILHSNTERNMIQVYLYLIFIFHLIIQMMFQ